ncbi:Crp/Fnr family transcriptional regulator [Pedobacter sp. P26]|uniref:Crp/Fnr family transcriptional regulator n=1 Tax=Pedobacter sp. P26 TaxID=3423956 RepID=UPI003D664376
MKKEQLINFIKENIPNISVTQTGLDTIAGHFEEIEFSKNEFLLKQGKVSGYYYLARGFVRAFTFDSNGNEITTFFYPAGRVAFEASSFSCTSLPQNIYRPSPIARFMQPLSKN